MASGGRCDSVRVAVECNSIFLKRFLGRNEIRETSAIKKKKKETRDSGDGPFVMSLRMAVPLLGEQSLGEGGSAGGGKPVSSRVTEMRPKKLLQIPLGTFLTLKKSKTFF